jgi:predicted acyltransferase (DUF342 family)
MNSKLIVGGDVSFNSKLFVSRDVSMNSKLIVGGDVSFNSKLFVSRDVSMNSKLIVGGDVSFNSKLFVSRDVSMNSKLIVGGDVSFNSKLFVASDVSMNSKLIVGDDVSFNSKLFVAGDVSMNSKLIVGGDVSFNSKLFVASDVSMNSKLIVGGDVSFNSKLFVGGDVSFNSKLFVSGDISIYNNTIKTTGAGLRQPPSAMTSDVTNIPGHGSYYAYNSSPLSTGLSYNFYDYITNVSLYTPFGFTSVIGSPNPTINNWAFADTISDINATAYPGYRFHLDLPYQINLSSFSYTVSSAFKRFPVQGSMLGSNNGLNWNNIYSFDLSGTHNNSTAASISVFSFSNNVSNTAFYSKYALVVKSMCSNDSATRFGMNEIFLYGSNNILSAQGIGTTSIGVSDNLTVGDTANIYGNLTVGYNTSTYTNNLAKLLIMEPSGSLASATTGSLVLQHSDASGASSIVFRSKNNAASDYAYIQYQENVGGTGTAAEKGLLTIGIENESPASSGTLDRMSLYIADGNGCVGINTKNPSSTLDISGNANVGSTFIVGGDVSFNSKLIIGGDVSFNSKLFVASDVSMNSKLIVGGDVSFNSKLFVASDVSMNSKLIVGGDVSFNSKLFVASDVSMNSKLIVGGDVSFNSKLFVASDVSMNSKLIVGGDVSFNSKLFVSRDVSMNSKLIVGGDVSFNSKLFVASDVSMNSKLIVGGDVSFNSKLFVASDVSMNSKLIVGGDVSFNSKLFVASDVSMNSKLIVGGDVSFNSKLFVASDVSMNSKLIVGGDVSFNSKLFVASDVSMNSKLIVGGDVSFNSKLFVASDVSMNSKLIVGGDVSFNSKLFVSRDVSMNSKLIVGGDVSFNSKLFVASDVSMNSKLIVGGDVSFNSKLFVAGDVSMNSKLIVGGDVSFNSKLFVAGDVSMNSKLIVGGDVSFNSKLFVASDVSMNSKLIVGGDVSFNSKLFVASDVSMNSKLIVGGDVSFNSKLFVASDVSMNSKLIVGGDVSFNSKLFVASDVSMNSKLIVGGDVSFNSKLFVASDVSMNSKLIVGGDVSFNSKLFVASDVSMNSKLIVGGDVSFNSKLFVSRDVSMNSKLIVGGDVSFNSKLFVASDVSMNSKLIVGGDVSFNSKLFVAGDVSMNSKLIVGGDVSFNSKLFVSRDVSFNSKLFVASDVSLNSKLYVGSSMYIFESVGSSASATTGSLIFEHGDASGVSSIVFKSKNGGNSDFGYIQYEENGGGGTFSNDAEKGIIVIGIENNAGETRNDSISLYASQGNGRIGVNTKFPMYNLDISGNTYMNSKLIVDGDVSFNSKLFVASDVSMNSKLIVGGDVSFNSKLFVASDVSMNSKLIVGGDVSFNSKLFVASDVSMNSKLIVGGDVSFNSKLFVASDVSMNSKLIVGGDVSFNSKLFVASDVSMNSKLIVGGDVSFNSKLFVASDASLNSKLFVSNDVSLNSNLNVGSGSSLVAINKNISTGISLDVSGQIRIYEKDGTTASTTGGSLTLEHTSTGGVSSLVFKASNNTNDYAYVQYEDNVNSVVQSYYKWDLSANVPTTWSNGSTFNSTGILNNALSINPSDSSLNWVAASSTLNTGKPLFFTSNNIYCVSFNQTNITQLGTSRVNWMQATVANSSNLTFSAWIYPTIVSITGAYIVIASFSSGSTFSSAEILFDFNSKILFAFNNTINPPSLISANAISPNQWYHVVCSFNNSTKLARIYINGSLSNSSNLNTINLNSYNTLLLGSKNGATTGQQLASSYYKGFRGAMTLVNVFNTAISDDDVLYLYNNPGYSAGNSTENGLMTIGIENNTGYYNNDRISIWPGAGQGFVGINTKDPTDTLDVNGNTIIRSKLIVESDVSFNSKLFVASDVSMNSKLIVGGDVSFNSKLFVGGDVSMNSKLIVGGDVSFNSKLFVSRDVSMNSKLIVGGDVSFNSKLFVGGDVSMNSKLIVGGDVSFNSKLFVSRDVSMNSKLIVGGDVSFNSKLFVASDVSMNSKLIVGDDVSFNGNFYVVKRSVFTLDVSMIGNLDIGSGLSCVAINKDISSAFALDVSGETKIRGNLDVSGVFTVNGAPVSGGGTLTGNVQVGSNSGFVTIDKPQFYSDPSLTIYYDFDSASYTGTTIANKGNGGATLTATLQGTTTGMKDTGNFYLGTASLRNEYTPSNNQGIKINSTVPIGTNMTFSFWLRKKSTPPTNTFDRIFEYSNNTTAQGTENNAIALDISSSGIILPVLTNVAVNCFGALTAPMISYNVCNNTWNHIIWSINGSSSIIYVNGSNVHTDTINTNPFSVSPTRTNALIGNSNFNVGTRDFSGNIDDFRYYKDKVLSYPEIYQLYNNNFYTLDICGGFLSNGSSVIYEPVGSVATANSGSLTLLHGNAGGSSSIMFKSNNGQGDYAYIEYDENTGDIILPYLKFDFSANLSNNIPSTGTFTSYNLEKVYTDASINAVTIASVGGTIPTQLSSLTPAPYCISFNQYNITEANTTNRISALWPGSNTNFINPFGSGFTFSAWIRPTTVSATNCRFHIASFVDYNRYNENAGRFIQIYIEGSSSNGNHQKIVVLINNDVMNYSSTTSQLTANRWYHYTFTFDNGTSTGYHYLDGVLNNTVQNSGYAGKTLTANSVNFALGLRWGYNYGDLGEKGFNGYMCYLNMFNYALSASDIAYLYNYPGYSQTTLDRGLMTIGVESESGRVFNDRISLWPSGGTGFVGVNTKTPTTTLDVSGQMRIYEGVGTAANPGSGTLLLEHANAGGTSSLVFKGPNSTTSDYAYVQYEDNNTITYIQSVYKWNLSNSSLSNPLSGTVDTSVGSNTTTTLIAASTGTAPLFSVLAPSTPSTFPSNTYCISFNQTNQTGLPGTDSISYLQNGGAFIGSTQNISFSFWIRPSITYDTYNNNGSYYAYYIAHVSNASSTSIIDFYIRGSDQRLFVLINGNGTNYKFSNSVIQNNVWTHVAFTYSTSPNNGYIYINGVIDELTNGTGYTAIGALNTYNFIIFGMRYGYNDGANYMKGFRGHMSFINIFNQTLSDSNITDLYNNPSYGQTTEGGLMTIGIENDTVYNDRIALWSNGGAGFVGINTKTPQATLDVSGDAVINGMRVGRGAGNNPSNIAFGYQALNSNTDGFRNVAIGFQALTYNKSGYDNIAIGYQALKNHVGGGGVGIGVNNIGLGQYALSNCTTGGNNTGVGFSALLRLTNSFHNVGIGRYAGVGDTSDPYNFQGHSNTFLGSYTGMTGAFSNSTAIGSGAIITGSTQIKLGRESNTEYVYCGSALRLNPTSTYCDIRNLNSGQNLNFGIGTTDYLTVNSSGITVNNAASGTLLTLKNASTVSNGSQVNIDFMTQTVNYMMARISAVDTTAVVNGSIGGFNTSLIFSLGGTSFTEYMRLDFTGLTVTGNGTFTGMRINGDNLTRAYNAPDFTGNGINNHNLVLVSTKTPDAGKTLYCMALGVDYGSGFGYINAAGNSVIQPLVLQSRGGCVGIGATVPTFKLQVDHIEEHVLKLINSSADYNNGKKVNIDFHNSNPLAMGRISCIDVAVVTPGSTFQTALAFYVRVHTGALLEAMRITGKSETALDCCSFRIYGTLVAVSYSNASDYRVKENVVPLDASFTVDGLNPVTYNLKSSGQQDIGFIAHEVQEFYPFLVNGEKDGKDTQSLNYNGFIGILTKEIQVLKKKVAEQEAKALAQEAKALAKALEQDQRIQALEKMVLDLINK